jgi:hypothetical protein
MHVEYELEWHVADAEALEHSRSAEAHERWRNKAIELLAYGTDLLMTQRW